MSITSNFFFALHFPYIIARVHTFLILSIWRAQFIPPDRFVLNKFCCAAATITNLGGTLQFVYVIHVRLDVSATFACTSPNRIMQEIVIKVANLVIIFHLQWKKGNKRTQLQQKTIINTLAICFFLKRTKNVMQNFNSQIFIECLFFRFSSITFHEIRLTFMRSTTKM